MGKHALWACCLMALLAACSSSGSGSSSSSSAPKGVDKAVWDDYCRQGADLASTLKDLQKGALTPSKAAVQLKRAQEHVASDAGKVTGEVQTVMRDLAATIGREQAAAAAGRPPNFDEIAAASGGLPRC